MYTHQAVRLASTRLLQESLEDLILELEDTMDELRIHEQYKPYGSLDDMWLGTVEEWLAMWESIKANIDELYNDLFAFRRELDRRIVLRNTRSLVSSIPPSQRPSVIFLEDKFMTIQSRKAHV